ncbi:uncharacterized protein F4822DRAFT_419335 [Hypoxylon trugodes]|uniref:uncharacterized protein n=1 Tax=Hypoxylon trugodes TaxID=326681 RepID=UPI00219192B5|nr:uncharacterized protein F4822DRAFT_419335 [Hypoxylon trugodes]KAI1384321.1 hypothetical protein F4822DRAFT_419335 [Hypoxylon trugodes]
MTKVCLAFYFIFSLEFISPATNSQIFFSSSKYEHHKNTKNYTYVLKVLGVLGIVAMLTLKLLRQA